MNGMNGASLKVLTSTNFDIWLDQLKQMLVANKLGHLLDEPKAENGKENGGENVNNGKQNDAGGPVQQDADEEKKKRRTTAR